MVSERTLSIGGERIRVRAEGRSVEILSHDHDAELAASLLTDTRSPVAELLEVLQGLPDPERALEATRAWMPRIVDHREIRASQDPILLLAASFHRSAMVRRAVVNNPCVPPSLLARMASWDTPDRLEALTNPALPASLLAAAVASPRFNDRRYAALNPKLSREQVDLLWNDDDEVRVMLLRNPHLELNAGDWARLRTLPTPVRQMVAMQTRRPDVLEHLASDPEANVRCAVADQHDISQRLYEQLASDPAATVRSRAAARGKLSLDVALRLAADKSLRVRRELANNQSLPETVYRILLLRDPDQAIKAQARWQLQRLGLEPLPEAYRQGFELGD